MQDNQLNRANTTVSTVYDLGVVSKESRLFVTLNLQTASLSVQV